MWFEEKICSISESAVSAMWHLQYEWRKRAVRGGGSHLKYEKKVSQCEERTYSIRRFASAVGGQGWWCEESLHYKEFHIYSMRTESVPYQKGRVYGMRRRLCKMRRKSTVSGMSHLKYE